VLCKEGKGGKGTACGARRFPPTPQSALSFPSASLVQHTPVSVATKDTGASTAVLCSRLCQFVAAVSARLRSSASSAPSPSVCHTLISPSLCLEPYQSALRQVSTCSYSLRASIAPRLTLSRLAPLQPLSFASPARARARLAFLPSSPPLTFHVV
jgi:hypothetical protein